MKKNLLFSIFFVSHCALAENISTVVNINSNVVHSCSVSIIDVNINKISLKTDTIQLEVFNFICTKNSSVIIDLKSNNFENNHVLTNDKDNEDFLKYEISISSLNGDWDNNSTFPKSLIGTGVRTDKSIKFTIFRGKLVNPGQYKDKLIMELTY